MNRDEKMNKIISKLIEKVEIGEVEFFKQGILNTNEVCYGYYLGELELRVYKNKFQIFDKSHAIIELVGDESKALYFLLSGEIEKTINSILEELDK